MKKLKLFTGLFTAALLLTGCATVGDVVGKDGKNVYYDDIVYNQGQVVLVEDYLYYGNSYFTASNDGFNYNQSSEKGYLARLQMQEKFEFDEDVENDYIKSTSPNGILKVNQRFVGYQNQNMFALGSYLYFTSPNTHKNTSLENDYTQVSLFRVKFNGDGFQEFGTYRHDSSSIITAQKGSDNNYYLIISEPTKDNTYDLWSIKIGDQLGQAKRLNSYTQDGDEIVDKVQTAVVCDSTSAIKNIVYTVSGSTQAKSVDFATGEIGSYGSGVSDLMGRAGDYVFYSCQGRNGIFFENIQGASPRLGSSNEFYSASQIKNIKSAGEGFVFVSGGSGSLMYKSTNPNQDATLLSTSSNFTDLLFADNGFAYVSNSTSISRIDVRSGSKEYIVEDMPAIISGQVGYDGEYIYFYSQLKDKSDENKDTNYYLYRTDKQGNYQLISQTK